MMVQCSSPGSSELNWGPPQQKVPKPSKQKCECCPYGYHIDLDFVRYCETFNSKSASPSSKLRERRRQRQSMEVLLGITSPIIWQLEQQVPQVEEDPEPQIAIIPEPPPAYSDDSGASASACRDALNKAVLDFEETFQRSHKKTDIARAEFFACFEDQHPDTTAPLYNQDGDANPPRSPSTVSILSSLSGDELMVAVSHHGPIFRPGHDSDVASIGSAASGVSTGALQIVREQMARSLEKMREMEDSLKLIPLLQSQVNVLKEEKRLMMLQVKAGEAEKLKLVGQIEAAAAEEKKAVVQDNGPVKVPSREVGVECSVLTRDVGVSHQGPKIRCASTQASDDRPDTKSSFLSLSLMSPKPEPKINLSISEVKHESISAPEVKRAVTVDKGVNTDKGAFKNKDCATELSMQNIYTDKEVEVMIEGHEKKIKREEEALRARLRVDKGMIAKPRCTDAQVLAVCKTRDIGVSEHTLTDLLCDKCNVRKKSIGVGSVGSFLRSLTPGEDNLSLASLTMSRSKSSDHFNMQSRLRPMASKETDTADLHPVQDKSSNTIKNLLIDRGVGNKVDTREKSVSVMIEPAVVEKIVPAECKTCEAKAEALLNLTPLRLTPSPTPIPSQSRIPRLANNAKSPTSPKSPSSPGKRPFKRQDTYTKIGADFTNEPIPEDDYNEIKESRVSPVEDIKLEEQRRQPTASTSTDDHSDEEPLDDTTKGYNPSGPLYTITPQARPRKKVEPSKEMRGAMKVMSDSLKRSPRSEVPPQLKNAVTIIQQEWFKVSSTSTANPLDVEDYLDCFEDVSSELLEHIVNMTDNSGNTAMHYAVSHGNFDVVSILLDSKVCNINQSNQAGYTSVMLVSLADVRSDTDAQVVQRLFQLADVNVRAKQHGQTALMLAASHGKYAMASMLLAAGADVNIQDEDGSTALMCAAEHGHVDMVKLILTQQDIDVNVSDHDGSTALNIAMEAGHRDVGVLLYAHQHFNSRSSSRTNSPYSTLKRRAK